MAPPNVAPTAPPRTDVIVVRTLATGTQRTVAAGTASDPTSSTSSQGTAAPSLSADGRCIAFSGRGGGLVDGVSPDHRQAFLRVLEGDCQTVVPAGAPGPAPGTVPAPGTPAAAPVVSRLRVSNRRFRVGTRRTASIAAVKRRRAPVGTAFRYTLSAAARVTITIERRTIGRRVGRTCRAATPKLRGRARCVRHARALTLTRRAQKAGARAVAFSGRVGRLRLKPGRHRAGLSRAS